MQNSGLLPHRTRRRQRRDRAAAHRRAEGEAPQRALELLDRVGLDRSLADRYPSQLSGGQQQRVGVARGLAADPNILLMDEPFGAVDPIVRDELQQELLRLQRELGKTIVFVTHDIDEAFLLGDQVVILEKGGQDRAGGHARRDPRRTRRTTSSPSFIGAKRGKRRLHRQHDGAGGRRRARRRGRLPGRRHRAPDGRLAVGDASPKSRSVSNKTDQAGDA